MCSDEDKSNDKKDWEILLNEVEKMNIKSLVQHHKIAGIIANAVDVLESAEDAEDVLEIQKNDREIHQPELYMAI